MFELLSRDKQQHRRLILENTYVTDCQGKEPIKRGLLEMRIPLTKREDSLGEPTKKQQQPLTLWQFATAAIAISDQLSRVF